MLRRLADLPLGGWSAASQKSQRRVPAAPSPGQPSTPGVTSSIRLRIRNQQPTPRRKTKTPFPIPSLPSLLDHPFRWHGWSPQTPSIIAFLLPNFSCTRTSCLRMRPVTLRSESILRPEVLCNHGQGTRKAEGWRIAIGYIAALPRRGHHTTNISPLPKTIRKTRAAPMTVLRSVSTSSPLVEV